MFFIVKKNYLIMSTATGTKNIRNNIFNSIQIFSRYSDDFNNKHGINTNTNVNNYKILIEIRSFGKKSIVDVLSLSRKNENRTKMIYVWGGEKKFFDMLNVVCFNLTGKTLDNQYSIIGKVAEKTIAKISSSTGSINRIDVLNHLWKKYKNEKDKKVKMCGIDENLYPSKRDVLILFILNQLKSCNISGVVNNTHNFNRRIKYLQLKDGVVVDTLVSKFQTELGGDSNSYWQQILSKRSFQGSKAIQFFFKLNPNMTDNNKTIFTNTKGENFSVKQQKKSENKSKINNAMSKKNKPTPAETAESGKSTNTAATAATPAANQAATAAATAAAANQAATPENQAATATRKGGSRRGRRTSSRSVSTKRRSRSRSVTKKKTTKRSSSKKKTTKKRTTSKTRKTKRTTKK